MEIQLSEPVKRGMDELGFTELTEIQEEAIPIIMRGEDIIAQSRTGTGKTAAFAIPILDKTWVQPDVQTLVLVPTRELAIQVGNDFRRIGKFSPARVMVAYGGTSVGRQIELLRNRVQIVIGTPGRVLDLINQRALDLSKVQFLVLDEADHMLDMGFSRDVEKIISFTPRKKQVMLFCVDLPKEVMSLAHRHLRFPKHVKLVSEDVSAQSVTQTVYHVKNGKKLASLIYLLKESKPEKALIFCRTKRNVRNLARELSLNGIEAEGIQGNLNQNQRSRIMQQFKEGDIDTLVATDVASRGIHVEKISHVFNYELPHDLNNYVHRIGRTGRMHAVGEAITLVYSSEMSDMRRIEHMIGKNLPPKTLPDNLPEPRARGAHANVAGDNRKKWGGIPWYAQKESGEDKQFSQIYRGEGKPRQGQGEGRRFGGQRSGGSRFGGGNRQGSAGRFGGNRPRRRY